MAMLLLCVALYALGGLIAAVGGIWLLVVAFRVSVVWGLGSLFVPFVSLAFVMVHWAEAKRAFLVQLVGGMIVIAGLGLGFSMVGRLATWPSQGDSASGDAASVSGLAGLVRTVQQSLTDLRASGSAGGESGEHAEPHRFVGQPIEVVERTLGRPKGKMTIRGRVGLLYDGFTLLSEDGRSITAVAMKPDFNLAPAVGTALADTNAGAIP